jgi:DNA-binding transcriptional ArsR family regulator
VANGGPELVDQRLTQALAHPTRAEILSILDDGPSSPSKIAKRLDNVSLNLASHHIKVLRELDCIELFKEVRHGGRTEHIYRATNRRRFFGPSEWEQMERKVQSPITVSILRRVSQELGNSLASGKFDETPDIHLSRTPMSVDREGWVEIYEILRQALEGILEVEDRCAARAELSGEELEQIRVVMMQFPLGPEQNNGEPDRD